VYTFIKFLENQSLKNPISGGVPKEYWSYKVNWWLLDNLDRINKQYYNPLNSDDIRESGYLYSGLYKFYKIQNIEIPYVPYKKEPGRCCINAILWDEDNEINLAHELGHWYTGPSELTAWRAAVKLFGKDMFLNNWGKNIVPSLSSYDYKPSTIDALKTIFQKY
jgi:hypothetical protein